MNHNSLSELITCGYRHATKRSHVVARIDITRAFLAVLTFL